MKKMRLILSAILLATMVVWTAGCAGSGQTRIGVSYGVGVYGGYPHRPYYRPGYWRPIGPPPVHRPPPPRPRPMPGQPRRR